MFWATRKSVHGEIQIGQVKSTYNTKVKSIPFQWIGVPSSTCVSIEWIIPPTASHQVKVKLTCQPAWQRVREVVNVKETGFPVPHCLQHQEETTGVDHRSMFSNWNITLVSIHKNVPIFLLLLEFTASSIFRWMGWETGFQNWSDHMHFANIRICQTQKENAHQPTIKRPWVEKGPSFNVVSMLLLSMVSRWI